MFWQWDAHFTLKVNSNKFFFFSIWIPEEFVWALNHQFTGSTNTGGLKADSRHRIKRLRREECLTLPSNSIVNRKCPFVAFVLILLGAATNLDTPFPNFTFIIYSVWAEPKSKQTNKQILHLKDGQRQQAKSWHWAIHQHNTGSLFSCTHRCTPLGTLYSPDGKKILIILIRCEGIEVMRAFQSVPP